MTPAWSAGYAVDAPAAATCARTAYHPCASRCAGRSPISSTGMKRLRPHIDRQRLERRDVERVKPASARRRRASGRDWFSGGLCPVLPLGQLHQRRQKAGKRLARAGRRDEEGRAVLPREGEKVELMGPRSPSATGEPGAETFGQRGATAHCVAGAGGHGLRTKQERDAAKPLCWARALPELLRTKPFIHHFQRNGRRSLRQFRPA